MQISERAGVPGSERFRPKGKRGTIRKTGNNRKAY
jgi:hypothetical protein